MPPHPELALVQALLVRSLVAMFGERPVVAPLVRWGTAAARRLPAAGRHDPRHRRGRRRPAGARHPVRGDLARCVQRVPVPAHRHDRDHGALRRPDRARAARRDRAVERARRRGHRRRHRPLRRLVGRARAGRRARTRPAASTWSPATRCPCRSPRRAATASTTPACGTARGSRGRRCTRPSRSTRRSPST